MTWVADSPEPVVDRARSEYLEMPGLRLTARQAARLWALSVDDSTRILTALTESGFLCRDDEGMFVRRGSCPRCS